MNRTKITLAATLSCAMSLYFLGDEAQERGAVVNETHVLEISVHDAEPSQVVTTETSAELSSPDEQAPEVVVADSTEADHTEEFAYEPPFPNRTNPFRAPKRQVSGRIKTSDMSETEVELLGFVDVFGPEVVLSIDGLAATVAEGGKQSGIEVISIQPPSVFLRRGKQRWQATLEN